MELGSKEWYDRALADAREVWAGAPPKPDRSMPHVDHHTIPSGSGVNAQRLGHAPSFHPRIEEALTHG